MPGPQVYQVGGQGQETLQPFYISAGRDPLSTDIVHPDGFPYPIGYGWRNSSTLSLFIYQSGGTWNKIATSAGNVDTLSDTIGTVVNPLAGNIQLAGTANQITSTAGTNKLTFSIPAAFIAPGSIASTTTLTGGTGITATTGNIAASAGNVSASGTVTGGTGVTATTGNIAASAGNVSASGTVTGGTGVTATTGNVAASAGNVSASGTVTGGTGVTATTGNVTASAGAVSAATTVTATAGNITATNGNLSLGTLGNKLLIAAGTNGSVGTFTLGGAATTVVANSDVTASSLIFLQTGVLGTVSAASTFAVTAISPGVNFTVTPSQSTDTSVVNFLIIN
jgi:hypothetical protein